VKYKAYSSYKGSGIEWLDKVPEEWVIRKLKLISTANDEVISDSAPQDEIINYIDIGGVSTGSIDDAVELLFSDAPSRARRIIKDGDILVSTVRTYLKAIAPVTRKYDGYIASTGFAVIRTGKNFDSGFAKYALLSSYFVDLVESRSVGISYPAINTSDLLQFETLLPSLQEQKSIANYLDKATAKIDTLIEKQTKLIELLKEKRQAVISSAVTRGLDASVPMKDSGVEWLGEIPEHWEVVGFNRYFKSTVDYRGKTPEKVDSGIFLVTARNIKKGFINYDASSEYVKEEEYAEIMSRGIPELGDVLFTTEAPLGEVANIDKTNIALAQRVIKFSGEEGVLNNYYLKYFMMSTAFQNSLMIFATGSTALGIKAQRLVYLRKLIPTITEQKEIAEYLDRATHKIDNLTTKSTKAIDLLKEKRTALISAAVTGKIDVRDAA